MNRLWVRFSLIIGVVMLVAITAPVIYRIAAIELGFSPSFQQIERTASERSIEGAELPGDLLERGQERIERRLWSNFSYALFAGSIVGIGIGILFSRMLTRPLNRLAEGAGAIAARQLSHRVPVEGSREIQVVAASFNQMAEALENAEMLRRNMLADVTHELRHPLHVLQGGLQAILDGVYPLEMEEIGRLSRQTHHLTQLVNDLHELAEAEAHQLPLHQKQTHINQLVAQSVDTLRPLCEEQEIQICVESPDIPLFLNIDPARMRQALNNLLLNAIRHTPQGGEITVRVSTEIAQEMAGTTPGARAVQIQVEDNGKGIAPENLPHLFDRFYRVDRSRNRANGGTGLGLAITKAIVEAHGGRLDVSSDGLGHGSTFSVVLGPAT